jgi:hypothetical protein
MRKTLISTSLLVVIGLASLNANAAVRRLSRDCPPLSAKESVSYDPSGTRWYLFTKSVQYTAKWKYWRTLTSGSWKTTARAYAGRISVENNFYGNVVGVHQAQVKGKLFVEYSNAHDCNIFQW